MFFSFFNESTIEKKYILQYSILRDTTYEIAIHLEIYSILKSIQLILLTDGSPVYLKNWKYANIGEYYEKKWCRISWLGVSFLFNPLWTAKLFREWSHVSHGASTV